MEVQIGTFIMYGLCNKLPNLLDLYDHNSQKILYLFFLTFIIQTKTVYLGNMFEAAAISGYNSPLKIFYHFLIWGLLATCSSCRCVCLYLDAAVSLGPGLYFPLTLARWSRVLCTWAGMGGRPDGWKPVSSAV